MDARYQAPTLSRFLSEDPSFVVLASNSADLKDPQKLNAYSYVENNPLRYTDPDGRAIYEAATIAGYTRGYGTHEFFYINSDHPEDVNIQGVPSGTTSFTIGGFPDYNRSAASPIFGNLVVQYGYDGKNGNSSDYQAYQSDNLRGTPVKIDYKKAGYKTEAELINAMGNTANSASGGNLYNPFGSFGGIYCNSNCFNQNIAYRTGIWNQISSFNPPGFHPGSGTQVLPSPGGGPSISASQYSAFISLSNAFTPTNTTQYGALQSVISAFGGKK
jgi:RHS repeat-associated protein